MALGSILAIVRLAGKQYIATQSEVSGSYSDAGQLCYSNSTEVLFGCWTLYNLRVVERIWGSKKLLVCHEVVDCGSHWQGVVVLDSHNPIHTYPSASTHGNPWTAVIWTLELHPSGPYTTHLRNPCPVSRRYTLHVPVSSWGHLIRPAKYDFYHNFVFKINELSIAGTTCAQSIPGKSDSSLRRMGDGICIQVWVDSWDKMEGPGMDSWTKHTGEY